MKPTIKNLVIICLLIFTISSCSNKKADLLIPKDASMVMHINTASLSSKLSWDEIKNSEWFKMFQAKEAHTEFEKKLLEDPATSGIDLKSDMYLFMKPSGRNNYMAFQGKLKDAKAFENMIKTLHDSVVIKKDGNISYAGDGLDFMTWTNDRFIMVGESEMNDGFGRQGGKLTRDSMLNFAKQTYAIKSNNSIASNAHAKSLLEDKGDLHFWVNSGMMMGGNPMAKQFSILKGSSVFEGNSTGITINFENGKITGTSKTFYNKELRDVYSKFYSANLNTDMLKKIPGNNVSAVLALNFKPEGIKAFLKLLNLDGLVDAYLVDAGLSLDDLINANKGDLMLAVTDFGMKEMKIEGMPEGYPGRPQPDAKILFATSINNKGAFDKVVDAVKNTISKQGAGGSEALNAVKYEVRDNWFIASNSQETVTAFGTGTTEHPFISKISGHPFGAYIDIKKIVSNIDIQKMTGMPSSDMASLVNMWDNIVMYGGEMKDDASVSYFEINMTDKNMNSLKQLNTFMSSVAKSFRGFGSDMNDSGYPYTDTTAMPAPPVKVEKK